MDYRVTVRRFNQKLVYMFSGKNFAQAFAEKIGGEVEERTEVLETFKTKRGPKTVKVSKWK